MSADDWLRKANGFIVHAKLLAGQSQVSGSIGPSVGLLAWQGTEDSLKAVCTGHNFPISHNLSIIMKHIKANNLMNNEELTNVSKAAEIVTGSATYNDTRYPESNLEWWENMPKEKLVVVTRAAQSIYETCAKKVASH
jgi:hypothetical protein